MTKERVGATRDYLAVADRLERACTLREENELTARLESLWGHLSGDQQEYVKEAIRGWYVAGRA